MTEERFLIIHFTDGSKMSVTFPKQAENAFQQMNKTLKALDASQITIEMDNELFVIPKNNIKYLQISPAPATLPDTVIRGGIIKVDN